MYNNEYELYHYGVKGMKWGVRRRSDQPIFRQASKKARADGLAIRKAARDPEASLKEQIQNFKIGNVAKRAADLMSNISEDGSKGKNRLDKGRRAVESILFPEKEKINKKNNFGHAPSVKNQVYELNKRGRVPTLKEQKDRLNQYII